MTGAPSWTTPWDLSDTGAVYATAWTESWASPSLNDPHATTVEPLDLPAMVSDEAERPIGVFLDLLAHRSVAHNAVTGTIAGIHRNSTGDVTATYSDVPDDVWGVAVTDGVAGNLTADPHFVSWSAASAWTTWDLHLATGSPCIDAGDPATQDADGSPADMGYYGAPDAP